MIYFIYQKTKDVEVKSRCVISAAELGKSHNRWYVMNYVIKMGGTDIDDNLAFRIGVEIEIDQRNKLNFQKCVQQINKTPSYYHKLIAEAINQ